jgi:ribose transport system permease protein
MSTATQTPGRSSGLSLNSIRNLMRDKPIIPLLILLGALVLVLEIGWGIVTKETGLLGLNDRWIANIVKFAIPLAILAGAQTLTMLTGGIDLSVGVVATMSAFVMATQVPTMDPIFAIPLALVPAGLAGLASGIGVGVFRVHPLIMTLAVGLVAEGFLLVYQRTVLGTSAQVPEVISWLGTGRSFGIPNSLLVFIPVALFIWFLTKRTGYGRTLYAIGDNEGAARLSGVRVPYVLIILYVISALLAGVGGLVYIGLIKATTLTLAVPLMLPSVAAAVIGGTSIFGGRGGYAGTVVGALILGVLGTLLTLLKMPEGVRGMLFGGIILLVTALYVRLTRQS